MAHSPHSVTNPSPASLEAHAQGLAAGLFAHLADAEYAVTALKSANFPLGQVALVARQFQRRDYLAGVDLYDRLESVSAPLPAQQAYLYEQQLGRGQYLMLVRGTESELNRAASILSPRGIQAWQLYSLGTTPGPLGGEPDDATL